MGDVTALEHQQLVSRPTFWHRARFRLVGSMVRTRGARTVVDLGAGAGLLGEWCATSLPGVGYRFAESSPALVAGLRERFGAGNETHLGDPVPPDAVVAMLDVIEHIADDVAALTSVRTSMPPSSVLVVTVPAHPWLFSVWDTALGHHRRYTRRSLRAVLHAAGFDVVELSSIFPELLPIAVLRRRRPGADRSADFPDLPEWVDRAGSIVAGVTVACRRVVPTGTSLVAVASPRSTP